MTLRLFGTKCRVLQGHKESGSQVHKVPRVLKDTPIILEPRQILIDSRESRSVYKWLWIIRCVLKDTVRKVLRWHWKV